ncbi:aminopeptidase N isoform X2 [Solenopsis invicta]|uniref:aminopeptidase N isoform X2 n=1 Tax=Solenopsis invicta TaxID=13686 RepID=UPI00193D95E8|nr:aminopeptidase N isoform X2 [Solenopsis invicta]
MNLDNIRKSFVFIVITIILAAYGELHNNCSISIDSPSKVVPIHYNISFDPDVKADFNKSMLSKPLNKYKYRLFAGKSSVTISTFRSTQTIRLFEDYKINERIIYIISAKLIKSNGVVYNQFVNVDSDILILRSNTTFRPGLYTLQMKFIRGTKDEKVEGFFRRYHQNKNGHTLFMLATYLHTIGAQYIFPCWIDPIFRTTFAISIKHHHNYTAISNMPVKTNDVINSDFMWTNFSTTPPLSTHHIAIVVTSYGFVRINESITLWCRECSTKSPFTFAMNIINNVTQYVQSEFVEVKIPKTDHIVIPDFPQDGTSKWGLIFHREADLIYNVEYDPIMRKIEVARLIAHKISFQWFGNAVSSCWWSFNWLHDGLATLYGENAVVKSLNNSGIMDFFIVQNQYESLHLDVHTSINPIQIVNVSQIESIFKFPRYIKVPIILRMIQVSVTDYAFRTGVRTYLRNYLFCSLTPDEFWFTQQDVANVLRQVFSSQYFPFWLSHNHYPDLIWRQRELNSGALEQLFGGFWIPTALLVKSFLPSNIKLWLTLDEPSYEMLHTLQDGWIIVDIQQAGYYRIHYEDDNWGKIINYLNSDEYKNISVINRAKIIDDAFHLMTLRSLNVSIFLKLVKYLWKETDYAVWYPFIKGMEYISNVFPISQYNPLAFRETYDEVNEKGTKINFAYIKGKLKKLFSNSLDKLGFEKGPMENELTECLRQDIVKWACILEYDKCLEKAKFKLDQHLQNPKLFKILPEWKKWTYCNGFKKVFVPTWEKSYLNETWLDNSGSKYVEYISCFQDDNMLNLLFHFLEYNRANLNATSKDKKISIKVFYSLIVKHARNSVVLETILRKFWVIIPHEINYAAALTVILNHIYSVQLIDKKLIKRHFSNHTEMANKTMTMTRLIDVPFP